MAGTALDLSDLNLTALPPEIGQLTALMHLTLRNNRLTVLPPEIGLLSRLTEMDLYRNLLTALPREIAQLTALTVLRLDDNQLTVLPPEIGQLTTLRRLNLERNHLTVLPPDISKLTALTELDLSDNLLSALPPEIGKLTALSGLSLYDNQFTTLPPEIGKLTALARLNLCLNLLTALPLEVLHLTALTMLYVHDNPGLNIPSEVLGPPWTRSSDAKTPHPNPRDILDYYFTHNQAAKDSGTEPLMEAKVLVLGEASVGKSCLIAALVDKQPRTALDGKGTSGIVRKLWEVPVKGGELAENPKARGVETLRLNCWDFGGQEIYHSAHTLFLTRRAIYVIVISRRENERQNNIDYWLRMAASFGGPEALTYVIVNKDDEQVGHAPDENALRLKYPHIRGFLRTSCDTLAGIEEARRCIVREALSLEGVRLPVAKTWLAVKKKLEKMQEHTLSMAEWETLCGKLKVTSEDARKEVLHLCDRLGTVRYFPTNTACSVDLGDTAILNPEWVTVGIYALFDDAELKQRGGMVDRTQMTEILKRRQYPANQERIIEEVMRRFDLLYDSADHGPAHRMLIPLMLPDLMPAHDWPVEGTLEFVYQYQVMPAGLVPAFMARRHLDLAKDSSPWRHGCLLSLKDCRVRVMADPETRRVLISVTGGPARRREALDQVRFTFESLHGTVRNLPVEQLIPVPGHPLAPMLDYEFVRSLEWESTATFKTKGAAFGETLTVNVREALDGVRGSEMKSREDAVRHQSPGGGDYHHHEHQHQHLHEGDQTMSNSSGPNINIGGSNYGNVGDHNKQIIKDSFNTISGVHGAELGKLFEKLQTQAAALGDEMKGKDSKELQGQITALAEEAKKPAPERDKLAVTAKGLVEAASTVKDLAGPVIATAGLILKFFGLPMP